MGWSVMCESDEETATMMGPDHLRSWFPRKKGSWRIDGPLVCTVCPMVRSRGVHTGWHCERGDAPNMKLAM